jgi:hypothetical protein
MRGRSYAIWWTEGDGRRHAGKLELSPFHALLAGNRGGRLAVPLDDIARVDYVLGRLRLETELRSEELPAETFSQLGRRDIRLAKTASRSTLGFMKEMAFELEWHIAHDGGLDRTDINELNHALRRTLRSHGGDYAQPIELVDQHLTTRGRPAAAL